jgi:hypothetical protein
MTSVSRIAEKLTEAQRRVLRAAKAASASDQRVFVPATVERRRWPEEMIETYSIAFRRLNPLGLLVRTHLENNNGR